MVHAVHVLKYPLALDHIWSHNKCNQIRAGHSRDFCIGRDAPELFISLGDFWANLTLPLPQGPGTHQMYVRCMSDVYFQACK